MKITRLPMGVYVILWQSCGPLNSSKGWDMDMENMSQSRTFATITL